MDRGKGAKRMIALLGMLFLLMNVVWLIHYASYSKYVNAEAGDSRLAMRTSYYFEESGITRSKGRTIYAYMEIWQVTAGMGSSQLSRGRRRFQKVFWNMD